MSFYNTFKQQNTLYTLLTINELIEITNEKKVQLSDLAKYMKWIFYPYDSRFGAKSSTLALIIYKNDLIFNKWQIVAYV